MAPATEKLFEDAMRLPEGERADLASRLIVSLESGADENVESLWDAEIASRVADLDQGHVKTIPWAEVRQMLWGRSNESANA